MWNKTDPPSFRALLLALDESENHIPQHDLRSFTTQLHLEMPDTLLHRLTPPSAGPLSGCLHHSCAENHLLPEEVLLITDQEPLLTTAQNLHMACAGLQRPQKPYLPAAYLFTSFSDELPAYLRQAFCRFHGLPAIIAHTPRLLIRETCLSDLTNLQDLYRKSAAAADTPDSGFFWNMSPGFFHSTEPEEFLRAYIHTMYELYGLGLYSVIHRKTGALIGHCGFDLTPDPTGYSTDCTPALGYLIAPAFRHQGYALEACRACLTHLSDSTSFRQVYCNIHQNNLASLMLAQKLGFRPLHGVPPSRSFIGLMRQDEELFHEIKQTEDSAFIILCLTFP